LYVAHRDPVRVWGEEKSVQLVSKLLFSAYQGPNANGFSALAQWILPAATHAEEEGTFTNFQGRVQRFHKAIEPLGQSRPDWEIWRDLLAQFGEDFKVETAADVFSLIARNEAAFKGINWEHLGPYGQMLAKHQK